MLLSKVRHDQPLQNSESSQCIVAFPSTRIRTQNIGASSSWLADGTSAAGCSSHFTFVIVLSWGWHWQPPMMTQSSPQARFSLNTCALQAEVPFQEQKVFKEPRLLRARYLRAHNHLVILKRFFKLVGYNKPKKRSLSIKKAVWKRK